MKPCAKSLPGSGVHVRPGKVIRVQPPNKKVLSYLSELLDYFNRNDLSA